MTSPDALARPDCPAALHDRWRGDVGWTALTSTPRMLIAALLFVPLHGFAQPADTTAAPATAASMAGTSTAPAPAAQEPSSAPRRPGETTTGRPPAPAEPAPSTVPSAEVPPIAPLPGDAAGATTAPAPATTTAPNPTATTAAPRVALPANPSPASAGSLLQTILALALVLGLLVGMAWFLKRFGPRPGMGSANLRVVGALNLGGRERIMVVEVGDQWIVVGAAPGRVNALHTMPRQEGELAPVAGQGGIPATSFSDWLKKTIDKRNAT